MTTRERKSDARENHNVCSKTGDKIDSLGWAAALLFDGAAMLLGATVMADSRVPRVPRVPRVAKRIDLKSLTILRYIRTHSVTPLFW
jgi:hypothetical protein